MPKIRIEEKNIYATILVMDKIIANWIKSSEYDIKSAEVMYKGRRFIYVIFMCHLSTEKALKAIVANKTKRIPPKTHDLFYLVKLADLNIPEEYKPILMHLNEVSVPTRYPEDMNKLVRDYGSNVARKYLEETKALLKWLKAQANLKK